VAFTSEAGNLTPGDTNGLDDIIVRQLYTAPNDFDGDSKTDVAIYRPSSGQWFIINSSTGGVTTKDWGVSSDVTVPGDYDGDGKTDVAIYRPSSGQWFIINSSTGLVTQKDWGAPGDVPVKSLY
jgi:hypothetical protein